MNLNLNKKTIAVTTASLLIIGGGAFAYVTAGGSGSGTGRTAAVQDITNLTGSVTGLGPGLTKSVSGSYTNANTFNVKPQKMTISVDMSPQFQTDSGCIPADFSTPVDITPVAPATRLTLIPGTGKTWASTGTPDTMVVGGTITMVDADDHSQTTCQTYLSTHDLPLTISIVQ